jgi:hypothetical protein
MRTNEDRSRPGAEGLRRDFTSVYKVNAEWGRRAYTNEC